MTSNTKILNQTIELLTGELKQVGEYRDNAVRCGVELNKQLAAMTARAELAERQVVLLCNNSKIMMENEDAENASCLFCQARIQMCDDDICAARLAAWSRAEAEKGVPV